MKDSKPYHAKALPPGTVLREWRLDGLLGTGGFGIVYRGTGVYFNDTVAIKEYFPSAISERIDGVTVSPTDTSSQELYQHGLQKFVEEAKILWNLSRPERHPNIVCVRSLFEIHGTAYMVMDFEDGVSLSEWLREGRLFDEASLMSLIRPIAEGLARAHAAGVYHRDIKPANILISRDGRPVLIDFGSARFETGQATSTKVTFYTPPYAALEQYVRTFPQGAWTDIYALAVTMFQCITGEKPPEVLERLHGGDGPPLAARALPGYSLPFLQAVDAALAIKPEDRPQSLGAWIGMLDPTTIFAPNFEGTRTMVGGEIWPPPGGFANFDEAPPVAQETPPPAKRRKRQPRYQRRGFWRSVSVGSIVFNLILIAVAVVIANSALRSLESRVDWPVVTQARAFTDVVIAAGRRAASEAAVKIEQGLAAATAFVQQRTGEADPPPAPPSQNSPGAAPAAAPSAAAKNDGAKSENPKSGAAKNGAAQSGTSAGGNR